MASRPRPSAALQCLPPPAVVGTKEEKTAQLYDFAGAAAQNGLAVAGTTRRVGRDTAGETTHSIYGALGACIGLVAGWGVAMAVGLEAGLSLAAILGPGMALSGSLFYRKTVGRELERRQREIECLRLDQEMAQLRLDFLNRQCVGTTDQSVRKEIEAMKPSVLRPLIGVDSAAAGDAPLLLAASAPPPPGKDPNR